MPKLIKLNIAILVRALSSYLYSSLQSYTYIAIMAFSFKDIKSLVEKSTIN